MRGKPSHQASMLSLQSPERRVPQDHPLRRIKEIADGALKEISVLFSRMYSQVGRPSIPPEQLLKASLLMAFYSIRSERMFCEQLDYNLLFRWFLDMGMDEPSFDHSTFSANRERLLKHDVSGEFFRAVSTQAQKAGLTSSEHFSVDGTLIDAWASLKSFRPKNEKDDQLPPPDDRGNPTIDFRGEKRGNATHESTTDPEAKLMRKGPGKEARLSYSLNGLMENRNGLLMDMMVFEATGSAERDAAIGMVAYSLPWTAKVTLGGDKAYDTKAFARQCREMNITPHVAQNTWSKRPSAIDGRTTSRKGYAISQRKRKLIEEVWGWIKTVGCFRKTRFRGKWRTQAAAYFVGAAYNLLRMAKLIPA